MEKEYVMQVAETIREQLMTLTPFNTIMSRGACKFAATIYKDMARTKKPIKIKEPIHLRMRERKNGTTSLYLDIYYNGERKCESLGLYLIPEGDNENAAMQNRATMLAANKIKSQRIIDLTNGKAGIKTPEQEKTKCCFRSGWNPIWKARGSVTVLRYRC